MRRAFTLVEVLTVAAIVAILLGVTAYAVGPGIAESRTAPGCASNLRQIAMVYASYAADNDSKLPTKSIFQMSNSYSAEIAGVRRCPLTHGGYWDDYGGALAFQNSTVYQTVLPNHRAIPAVDFERDVLYRCLDHGYAGFVRGTPPGQGRLNNKFTRGFVLGVRLDGSVTKVAPFSCWQFRYFDPAVVTSLPNLWANCDDPAVPPP
ncbi:MAG: type II secretion system protein [Fimbriimonadaceae bacterium]